MRSIGKRIDCVFYTFYVKSRRNGNNTLFYKCGNRADQQIVGFGIDDHRKLDNVNVQFFQLTCDLNFFLEAEIASLFTKCCVCDFDLFHFKSPFICLGGSDKKVPEAEYDPPRGRILKIRGTTPVTEPSVTSQDSIKSFAMITVHAVIAYLKTVRRPCSGTRLSFYAPTTRTDRCLSAGSKQKK